MWGDDPEGDGAILGVNICPTSLIQLIIVNWIGV